MAVKYFWSESNGGNRPSNKYFDVPDGVEYYVGMPMKKVDENTVEPTDGDPEFICMMDKKSFSDVRVLEIPCMEIFPDTIYEKWNDDGTIEEVRFGSGGDAVLDENGKLLNEVLPVGYPYEETVTTEVTQLAGGVSFDTGLSNATLDASIMPFEGKDVIVYIGEERFVTKCESVGDAYEIPLGGSFTYLRENVSEIGVVTLVRTDNTEEAIYVVRICIEEEQTKGVPIVNHFLPKGYPYEEVDNIKFVVPEQTVMVQGDGDGEMFVGLLTGNLMEGEVGKTYTVTFDGVEYECVFGLVDSYGVYYIGNIQDLLKLPGYDGEKVPFLIMSQGGGTQIVTSISGMHTVSVAEITRTIHPIAERFLPNKRMVIDVTNLPTDTAGWEELHDKVENIWAARGDIYFLNGYGKGYDPIKVLTWYHSMLTSVSVSFGGELEVYMLYVNKSSGGYFKTYTVDLTEKA